MSPHTWWSGQGEAVCSAGGRLEQANAGRRMRRPQPAWAPRRPPRATACPYTRPWCRCRTCARVLRPPRPPRPPCQLPPLPPSPLRTWMEGLCGPLSTQLRWQQGNRRCSHASWSHDGTPCTGHPMTRVSHPPAGPPPALTTPVPPSGSAAAPVGILVAAALRRRTVVAGVRAGGFCRRRRHLLQAAPSDRRRGEREGLLTTVCHLHAA